MTRDVTLATRIKAILYGIFAVQSIFLYLGAALVIGYIFPDTSWISSLTTVLYICAIVTGLQFVLSVISDIVADYDPDTLSDARDIIIIDCGVMIAGIILLIGLPAWQTSSDPQGMLFLAVLIAFFTLYAPWMQQVGSQTLTTK